MSRRILIIFFFDILFLSGSFLFLIALKPASYAYFTHKYLVGYAILLVSWVSASFFFNKYDVKRGMKMGEILKRILQANFVSLALVSIFIVAFELIGYSRLVFFGTIAIATLFDIVSGNLHYLLIHSSPDDKDLLNPPPRPSEIKKARDAVVLQDIHFSEEGLRNAILEECGQPALEFIEQHADLSSPKTLVVSTTTRFNIELQPDDYFNQIVNLKRLNDIRYINKFFESVNRKLPQNGLLIGCVETKALRKERILHKYPPVLNWIMYSLDFLVKRVFPKFILTKKLYFILTRGENRVITRAEVLGRLYSCGFQVKEERFIGHRMFFAMNRVKEPAYDFDATYGPFVKLRRIGKGGKYIKVYKLRTMHPYAEYLQDYVYRNNHLNQNGKFKDDFRVSTLGKLFRKLWLDEVPMIFNVLKGEMKLVGVRPLSEHYFSLYSKELQEKRIRYLPGLIPPFYADLPKNLEEIQESEMRYLNAYEKHPIRTDWKYFWKAIGNILFKKARSG